MPAPPPIVSQQPMPPVVAEPPTPTRLTPVSGPSTHYRPAQPTSPYEPQPRHAPAPRPEQDAPIRPEFPPGREVSREPFAPPREEPGQRTDDLNRRDLSAAPVTAPPYGHPTESVDAAAPILIPLEPLYPDATATEPVSAAPSWFDAPVSGAPAIGADTPADLEPDESDGPAEPVRAESISTDNEPAVEDHPAAIVEADAEAPAGGADEDGPGLGWLLSLSGLGASTPGPDGQPESEVAAEAPVSAQPYPIETPDPDEETEPSAAEVAEIVETADEQPAEDAEEGPDWFAPATDPRMQRPDHLGDTLEDTEPAAAIPGESEAEAEALGSEPDQAVALPATEPAEPVREEVDSPAPITSEVPLDDHELDDVELDEEPERRLVDPEQVLAAYAWRFDPETLRENADDHDQLRAVRDRLTDKLEYAERHAVRARLLSLRAVVSRVLGDQVRGVADGRRALKHALATGELRRISITQARLAHVLQWRGDHAAADRMFEEANSAELPDRLRAEISELAGRSAFEQGRFLEALNHFERALHVRRADDDEMIARIETALDAIKGRALTKQDWGPWPRSREEILQQPGALHPTLGFDSQLWGYADREGELVVPERYAEARPFHDGVAWVLRPQARAWELIDTAGTVLIGQSAGYLATGPFADGLAWVSRDATGGWFAIDRENRVIVAGGFDDVRAFHSGLAPVRRIGWGAVDRYGRLVVQPKYLGFATALTSGRHLDGFTDEGLAIVDAGDRKGVIDRSGQLIVPPVHAALLIHPVAFVIGDRNGRWGALDRQGEPLIDVVHASQADVADEIDRLLADTRPVL